MCLQGSTSHTDLWGPDQVLPLRSFPGSRSQDQFSLQMLMKVPGDKMAWAQPRV